MTTVKNRLFILLTLCVLSFSTVSYGRHAAILIDADSGKIIRDVEANHAWFPASLTKVMTLYMTFTALAQGQIQLSDSMVTSAYAARQPNSKLGLRIGEAITVEEAILALITRSANDASVVLAEHLGGNEENFAARMTAKAHALGMYDTHFMNATGLPHQWQVTTPRDLGLLAWRTWRDFPNYYRYFGARSLSFRGREWAGINKFTAHYLGAEGMKTGFTCGSGYNLISSAQQNGRRLMGVVMGGMTSSERYQLMTDLMDTGFADNSLSANAKHITALVPKSPSIAPYQLPCGRPSIASGFAQYTARSHSSQGVASAPHRVMRHFSAPKQRVTRHRVIPRALHIAHKHAVVKAVLRHAPAKHLPRRHR
jgi:D-alanyl-D-alanine carboxypeptidase